MTPSLPEQKCETCGGDGRIALHNPTAHFRTEPCEACNGTGRKPIAQPHRGEVKRYTLRLWPQHGWVDAHDSSTPFPRTDNVVVLASDYDTAIQERDAARKEIAKWRDNPPNPRDVDYPPTAEQLSALPANLRKWAFEAEDAFDKAEHAEASAAAITVELGAAREAVAGMEKELLARFDAVVAAELPRVSHVKYDSHEICKHFANELRARICALAKTEG